MRVQMVTYAAGPAGVAQPGQIVDVPPAEAKALIDGNYAIAVPQPEAAAEAAPSDTSGDEGKTDGKKKTK